MAKTLEQCSKVQWTLPPQGRAQANAVREPKDRFKRYSEVGQKTSKGYSKLIHYVIEFQLSIKVWVCSLDIRTFEDLRSAKFGPVWLIFNPRQTPEISDQVTSVRKGFKDRNTFILLPQKPCHCRRSTFRNFRNCKIVHIT